MTFDPATEIVGLDEYVPYVSICLYSEPGVGKTVWLASAKTPTLILATEPGTVSAARMLPNAKHVKVIDCSSPYEGWRKYEEVVEWLKDGNAQNFDWIQTDTATRLQRNIMLGQAAERSVDASAKNQNIDKFQLDEYGTQQNAFMRLVETINDLEVNTVWACHAVTQEDIDGDLYVKPNIHGKDGKPGEMSTWLSANCMMTGYMRPIQVQKKGGEKVPGRQIVWQGNKAIRAKDRFACLGEFTVDKTLAQVQDIVFAE